MFLFATGYVRAAGAWTQTTWSAGAGTSTTNQYESQSNVDTTTTAGQFSLPPTDRLTNANFDTDLSSWTTPSSAATPAVVQSIATRPTGTATSIATTFVGTPVQNNTIIAVYYTLASPGTVTTPAGFTLDSQSTNSSANSKVMIFRKLAGASESRTVTVASTVATSLGLNLFEVSGLDRTTPLDQAVTANSGASTVASLILGPTPVTTMANEFALGAVSTANSQAYASLAWNNSFTKGPAPANAPIGSEAYAVLNATQAVTTTFTPATAVKTSSALLTYKAESYITATAETGTKYEGAGSVRLVTSASNVGNFAQSVNVGDTNSYSLEAYAYTTGAAVTSADAELYVNGSTVSTTYTSAGGGWYKLKATVTGVASALNYGLQVKANKTVYADSFLLRSYPPTGTLTSAIYDLGYGGDWGTMSYTTGGSGSVAVKVRTGNSADMSDAPAFSGCSAIASGTDLTGQSCVTNNHHYVQYQVALTSDTDGTPIFNDISISFAAWDSDPPSVNASNISMARSNGGATVASNGWTNGSTPYFAWNAAVDAPGGVGIKGYCLYLGPDQNADPVTTKGLLGTSPLDTGGDCQFAIATEHIDLATSGYLASAMTTSNAPYYLSIKALDDAGNVYGGAPEEFHFRFDNTPPTPPAFITAPSQFVASKNVALSWPDSGNDAADDANSGLVGLQYRIGSGATWYGDTHDGSQGVSDLLVNDGSYTTVDPIDYDLINEGNNIIYFRSWDAAGNISTNPVTTVLKINTSSPSSPQSVTATPSTNTSNSFAFSWNPPSSYTGSSSNLTYCYTINTLPTVNTCSFTLAGVTSLPASAYATQPGENTFYVVAKDEAGNINYATAASAAFTANTSAPGVPLNLDVVDISVKSTSNWRLALSWDVPTDIGAGIATYKIYRSTNNSSYSSVASTSGTSYVDSGLSPINYYYKVAACDSANNCGAQTTMVTKKPTGKYTTPAEIVSAPKVSQISTRKATVNWSTDRASDSRIQYGLISGQYFATEAAISTQTTDHEVTLNNLTAGTTYYAKAKWTDEDGNTGQTSEFSFSTSPAPVVKEVNARPTLSDAIVSFTTKDATKVKIYYGKSDGFGGLKTVNTSLSESGYSLALDGLDDGSKYYYKLNALDEDGNEYEGNVYSFTTPPRPQITNLRFQPMADQPSSTQKVSWNTNVAATSELSYGIGRPTQSTVVQQLTTSHEVVINGLADDSTYVLQARSRDENGNLAVSDQQVFRTSLDTRPPKISDVVVDASVRGTGSEARGQVVVSWKTDEPSTSQVAYGEGSTGFLSSTTSEDAKLTTDHVVVVSDLSTSRVYHFEPRSFDRSRNQASGDQKVSIIGRASDNVLTIIFNSLQKLFGIK